MRGQSLRAAMALVYACCACALRPARAADLPPAEALEDAPPIAAPADTVVGATRATAPVGDTALPAPPAEAAHPAQAPKRARFRSDFWLPIGSAVLPGFGQFFQGDRLGLAYAGAALAGLVVYGQGLDEARREDLSEQDLNDPGSLLSTQSWTYRKIVLGGLAYQGSGFLSAYSAFRIAAPRFQQEKGRYGFLGEPESAGELMAAPFRFGELAQPSAYIPLGLLAAAVGYLVGYERSGHPDADWTLSWDDLLFTGAESWNAGVSEEAAFRGWIFPFAYQYLWNDFWLANGAQALLFGLAHYDAQSNAFPWPQALLGFYFGWLTKKNGWTLSESIFVHAWWDMLLFAGEAATAFREPAAKASLRIDLPMRW